MAELIYQLMCLLLFTTPMEKSGTLGKEIAISKSIEDFCQSERMFQIESVFWVEYYDSIGRMEREKIDSLNYKWVRNKVFEDKVAVSIAPNYNEKLLLPEYKIGEIVEGLPSRYALIDGKLFYWYDSNYPLTEEMLQLLEHFNLIQRPEDSLTEVRTITVPTCNYALHYYYCRNNLSKFVKTSSKIAIQYYNIPLLNCNCCLNE